MNIKSKFLLIEAMIFVVSVLVLIGIWYMSYCEDDIQILMRPEGKIERTINEKKFLNLQTRASEGRKYWVINATSGEIIFHYDNHGQLMFVTIFWIFCCIIAIIFCIKSDLFRRKRRRILKKI